MKKQIKKKMGCDCGIGCDCNSMGKFTKKKPLNPLLFLVGAGVGVGVWYLLKNIATAPGATAAFPYANLAAVAARLDELKTLYRSGRLTPEQALEVSSILVGEARKFVVPEGGKVNQVVDDILSFETEIQDFIKLQTTQGIS